VRKGAQVCSFLSIVRMFKDEVKFGGGMCTSSALLPCQLTPLADSGVLDLMPFFLLQSAQNQDESSSLTASSETAGS